MKLFLGLGNPGPEYTHTRHNIGFLCVDALAKQLGVELRGKRALEAECGEGLMGTQRVLLCKPQTFMNASGRALKKILTSHPIAPEDIMVFYDDADLTFGDVRLKTSGSSAGHRGMQSVLEVFPASTNIARIRMGIGRPAHPDIPLDQFVLQRWTDAEEKHLPEMIEKAIGLYASR